MHASEIAYKAADYIEQNGHMKYQLAADPFNDADRNYGSACLRGAIRITMGESPRMGIFEMPPEPETIICKQIIKDYDLVSRLFDDSAGNVCAEWNNDDERTADDVIRALRKAGDNLAVAA